MQIEECKKISEWNEWLLAATNQTPLVAHGLWGQLLEREGSTVRYFFVREADHIIAGFPMVSVQKRFFSYAYSARGPISVRGVNLNQLFLEISQFIRKQGFVFWRLEPTALPQPVPALFRKATDIQPANTLVLDLLQTSDELLAAMHQKTRYNIRLSLKKNLEVRFEKNPELFWQLSVATSQRDNFRLHTKQHYEAVIASDFAEQVTVYNEGVPVASAVCTLIGTTYTYLFGASSYEARALMAPYLIQWSAILRGQERGARWYDFYGLSPVTPAVKEVVLQSADAYTYDTNAKEAGYTRFKLGFGGSVLATPGTWEIVLFPFKYELYRSVRALRRLRFFSGQR